ncbi:MAG: tRNA (adenine-N1)-methyltransferase [Anaerolineales bacterium]|jgi:tRNA (adenine57-N1/adenine58-N1)-methyltransferase
MNSTNINVKSGELVLLIDEKSNTFIIKVGRGEQLHTHRGILQHDDVIDSPWGNRVFTHTGYAFLVVSPTLGDLLMRIRRSTQIMYPKDIGFLLVNMGIGPGKTVIEAGTGSGALTTAISFMVGEQGHVYSYEIRPDMQAIAKENLERVGLDSRVTFKLRDIHDGFDESGVDALILDVPNPEDFLPQVRRALAPGKPFGALLPTTNQISRLLNAFTEHAFGFVEVCEIMLRFYKPVPERLRPADRMVGHTGFLIFARPSLEGAPLTASLHDDEAPDFE